MTRQYNDGTRDCQNLGYFTAGAEAIWALGKLAIHWGYTLFGSGDNAGNAVDMVTYQGTGVGGLDRSGAWIGLQEPLGGRQYLFSRRANHQTWWPLYSATGAYVLSVPPTTIPVAAVDEVNLYLATGRAYAPGHASQRTDYALFPSTMSHRCHCCVDDAPSSDTDVYPFWMFISTNAGVEATTLICTAMVGEGGLMTPGTVDPAVFYCHLSPPTYTVLSSSSFSPAGMLGGFYGGEFDAYTCRYFYDSGAAKEPSSNFGPNVVTSRYALQPICIGRSSGYGAVPGDAGVLWDVRWNVQNGVFVYGAFFDDEAYAGSPGPDHLYVVDEHVVLTGWFSAVTAPSL